MDIKGKNAIITGGGRGIEAEDWDSIMDPSDVGEYVLTYLKLPDKMYIKNAVLSNSNAQMKPYNPK